MSGRRSSLLSRGGVSSLTEQHSAATKEAGMADRGDELGGGGEAGAGDFPPEARPASRPFEKPSSIEDEASAADDERSGIVGATICFTPGASPGSSSVGAHAEETRRGRRFEGCGSDLTALLADLSPSSTLHSICDGDGEARLADLSPNRTLRSIGSGDGVRLIPGALLKVQARKARAPQLVPQKDDVPTSANLESDDASSKCDANPLPRSNKPSAGFNGSWEGASAIGSIPRQRTPKGVNSNPSVAGLANVGASNIRGQEAGPSNEPIDGRPGTTNYKKAAPGLAFVKVLATFPAFALIAIVLLYNYTCRSGIETSAVGSIVPNKPGGDLALEEDVVRCFSRQCGINYSFESFEPAGGETHGEDVAKEAAPPCKAGGDSWMTSFANAFIMLLLLCASLFGSMSASALKDRLLVLEKKRSEQNRVFARVKKEAKRWKLKYKEGDQEASKIKIDRILTESKQNNVLTHVKREAKKWKLKCEEGAEEVNKLKIDKILAESKQGKAPASVKRDPKRWKFKAGEGAREPSIFEIGTTLAESGQTNDTMNAAEGYIHAQLDEMWAKLDGIECLRQLEDRTGVPRELISVLLLLSPVFLGMSAGTLCGIAGFVYPALESFRALEHRVPGNATQWLVYWVVYAYLSIVESFADILLRCIPFYYAFKLVFLLWFMLPQTRGAKFLYDACLKDFLKENESKFDSAMKKWKAMAGEAGKEAKESVAATKETVTKKEE